MRVTAERVRELFNYDEVTGVFTRKVRTAMRTKIGDIVGNKDTYGYLQVSVDGKLCLLHRLAWLYVHGEFPEGTIDHIDRCKTNNAITNLRDVSQQVNMTNLPVARNNRSGFKGVFFRKDAGKYFASVSHKGKRLHVGVYDTASAASSAYELARYFLLRYDTL